MPYSERIKNFEKVRSYIREFYVYGFKSRTEYDAKSARSYDDERRRIESWLGDYMRFTQTAEGKNVFLSVDSRVTRRNPFYKAWKAKSFTDGDITLHFAIFDILYTPEVRKTLAELVEEIDRLLSYRMTFDESTVRKKLKEYEKEGIIQTEKEGRRIWYRRSPDTDLSNLKDVIDFFSEVAPCGVIGSFLQDRYAKPEPKRSESQPAPPVPESARLTSRPAHSRHKPLFSFKHHYMTQAMDSDVMAMLFEAIQERRYVTVDNLSRRSNRLRTIRLVPLKLYISAQNGRQNLIAYHCKAGRLNSYRLDYLSNIRIEEEVCEDFDALRDRLRRAEGHMWGVNCKKNRKAVEHVEFELRVGEDEEFIVRRLEREKRCGRVEKVDENHYRYIADVFDTREMVPWIRTFLCRITRMNFSNRTVENQFKADIEEMYRMYGLDGGDGHDFQ